MIKDRLRKQVCLLWLCYEIGQISMKVMFALAGK